MNREREAQLLEILSAYKHTEVLTFLTELLALRRERHRDKLENGENAEMRGRAKECKDLLQIFS